MSQLCLDGPTLHDASTFKEEPDRLAVESRALATSSVLRQIYPKGENITANDVVVYFRAGQVHCSLYALLEHHEPFRSGVSW